MTPPVYKSPFHVLRYIAYLFRQQLVLGNAAQKRDFLQRLSASVLRKVRFFALANQLFILLLRITAFLKSPEQRALVTKYGRWLVAISNLDNCNVLTSWLTDRAHPHIVVMGMGSVGDVLQITPVLRALKEKCPTAEIAVLHRSPAAKTVLKNNPHVSTVAKVDFHHFDAVIKAVKVEGAADLIVEIRSMSFILSYISAPPNLRHRDFNASFPESFFTTAETVRRRWITPRGYQKPNGKFAWVEQWKDITYLDALGMIGNLPIHAQSNLDFFIEAKSENVLAELPSDMPVITVQTGVDADVMNWAAATGQRPTKLLPAKTWAQIVQQLAAKKFAVVQLGMPSDIAIEGVRLDLRGKTSLSQAATCLKRALFHIGTEGGLVHLARAVETKSIVLFGPTSSEFLGYPQNINLNANDCNGCWGATKDWYIYCPRGLAEPECMNAFTADVVLLAVNKLNLA